MRRVLLVSAMFPPEGGGGVQRAAKLAKYLPHHGWTPVVLASKIRARRPRDPTLLADLDPALRVERAGVAVSTRAYDATLGRARARRLYDRVVKNALLGDPGFADVPEMIARGVALGRRHRVDAVIATSSPFSSVVAGDRIARLLSVPLIADMRDPWARSPFVVAASTAHRRAMEALEDRILSRAAGVVTVVDGILADLPAAPHAIVIPNGFDPEDLDAAAEACPPHIFRVAYTGTLYGPRASRTWLDGLGQARDAVRRHGRSLQLAIAGQLGHLERRLGPMPVMADVRGYSSHAESVALIKSAAAILVLISTEPTLRHATSAKLYEAIAAGPPVIAWARRDGECAKVLADSGAGWVGETSDEIAAFIAGIASGERQARPLDARADALAPFDRREIAERFAGLLNRVVS